MAEEIAPHHPALRLDVARMRYQQSVFDTMMLGLRLGGRPRVLIATTPRTTPFMKRLVAMDDIRITTGSTYDNAEHPSAGFLKKVRELYEGTRPGRQELQGAMILDPMNALFKDDWLIHNDVPEDLIEQVTVGVDPSGGDDEVGIVASALLQDGRFAVLADRSATGSPAQWGEAVVRCSSSLCRATTALPRARGRNDRSCAGFWTPATMKDPRAQLAGVQKAPRHEVAGSWAPVQQRAL
jgi:phage terminase large subunit-like protein